MSGEILFLAHRIPFPPDRGDKIRSHHVLRHLAGLAPVHVACFGDDARDMGFENELAQVAASHCLVLRNKPLAIAGIEALTHGCPVSLPAFSSAEIARYVRALLSERPISAIYVFSSQMGQFVPDDFAGRVICDFVDVDSAKFEAYGHQGRWPMRWINAREGRLLAAEEARLARRADVSLFVSAEEAALFAARLDPSVRMAADIRALRNGIESTFFNPLAAVAEPQLAGMAAPRLIFTGQMDYAPNVAAAVRAIDRILPAIRAIHPGASLHIVGRNPPPGLQARSGSGGVHVWGAVEDMRCWLAGADLAVVPLDIARGVQNKVLEAMAMGLPIVCSPDAAVGIGGEAGVHYATGADDAELVARALDLLADDQARQRMGAAARRFVCDRASWNATLEPLSTLLGLRGEAARNAA